MEIITILASAFLGGLILNVMPCVLPVLSIKMISVIKYSGRSRAYISTSFLVTALGIITSFLLLATIVIYFKSIGENLGWGFQFQDPSFIITIILILILFSMNQWGIFEITLPNSILNKLDKVQGQGYNLFSYKKSFFTGVLATLMATPCSAPFLGTAIAFVVTANHLIILLIFTFIGIGLATPYLFFSVFPSLITKMPKPGQWMVKVKKTMAVFLMLTTVWLLYVLFQQIGSSYFLVIIANLILIIFILFLRKTPILKSVCFIFLSLVCYYVTFDYKKHFDNLSVKADEKTLEEEILRKSQDNVVFVDVTADWCVTCKFNKINVLNTKEIQDYIERNNVTFLTLDYTNSDKKIKAFLKKHERNGIPFNIIYGPSNREGIKLREILKKDAVIKAIEKSK